MTVHGIRNLNEVFDLARYRNSAPGENGLGVVRGEMREGFAYGEPIETHSIGREYTKQSPVVALRNAFRHLTQQDGTPTPAGSPCPNPGRDP